MPTTIAPGIPPGKAYGVPIPNMFLMIPMKIAAMAAQHGPTSTPKIALIMCCVGLAFVPKKTNQEKGAIATPKAEKTITTANFFTYPILGFVSFQSPLQTAL